MNDENNGQWRLFNDSFFIIDIAEGRHYFKIIEIERKPFDILSLPYSPPISTVGLLVYTLGPL